MRRATGGADSVRCPICDRSFSPRLIEAHANACVSKQLGGAAQAVAGPASDSKGKGKKREAANPDAAAARKRSKDAFAELRRGAATMAAAPRPLALKDTPFEVIHDVLPQADADALLRLMLSEAEEFWESYTLYVNGKKGTAHRKTLTYSLREARGENEKPSGVGGVSYPGIGKQQFNSPALLLSAAAAITEHVAARRQRRSEIEDSARLAWRCQIAPYTPRFEPTVALGNHYSGGDEDVGPHSDRLTYLGPMPIICGLVLGARRPFLIQTQLGSSEDAKKATVSVPMPHNSVVIMWPGAQEGYKHGVPKTATQLRAHPISGTARVSLTFRQLRPEFEAVVPACRECGQLMVLKAAEPTPGGGKSAAYYYACSATNDTPPCGTRVAAPWWRNV